MIPDALAELLGQGAEEQIQSGSYKKGTDGKYKPGMMDHFWGRADDGQKYLDQQKQTKIRDTFKPQVEGLGGTYTPGQTEGQYRSQVNTLTTQKTNDDYTNSPAGKAAEFARNQQTQQFAESSKRADNQFAITNKRLDTQTEQARLDRVDARKDRLQDRIDGRESRADDLMFRRETMERADRKDEKSRRRESIQALVAGLSSLGAAFAV